MKRRSIAIVVGVLSLVLSAGCNVGFESDSAAEEADAAANVSVGEAAQALPFNCVGMCVAEYRACITAGGSYAECAAGREACKDVCDEATCEPGEPGCCQGQPTCW